MRFNLFAFALILSTILSGCNPNKEEIKYESSASMNCLEEPIVVSKQVADPKASQPTSEEIVLEEDNALSNYTPNQETSSKEGIVQTEINKKKIIKDGSIDVKTKDVFKAKKDIDEIVKKHNAYYDEETFENNVNEISYLLKIRIPANNFELFVSSIESGKNEITNKSIEARDVTEEWVDIETRLSNKKEYLKRYKELLSKATTIKDIIAIQENIRSLQEEIESSEGRLRYLSDQVSYSTLTLKLTDPKKQFSKVRESETFIDRTKNSLVMGWASVIDFLMWILANWPLILILAVSTFFIRWIIRKRKHKKSK